jgi:hypothetical protein
MGSRPGSPGRRRTRPAGVRSSSAGDGSSWSWRLCAICPVALDGGGSGDVWLWPLGSVLRNALAHLPAGQRDQQGFLRHLGRGAHGYGDLLFTGELRCGGKRASLGGQRRLMLWTRTDRAGRRVERFRFDRRKRACPDHRAARPEVVQRRHAGLDHRGARSQSRESSRLAVFAGECRHAAYAYAASARKLSSFSTAGSKFARKRARAACVCGSAR